MKASVIGLGKLGIPMAACMSAKGIEVIGVDVDESKVTAINERKSPIFEPGLEELLPKCTHLYASNSIEYAVHATEITFVVVATPSLPDGQFSLEYILPVCEAIGKALKQKSEYHTVVITSTVMPGHTDGPIRAKLEEISGKKASIDFGLIYNPEFIALGSVIKDFQNPDIILMGECGPHSHAGWALQEVYKIVCDNQPKICHMNPVNAELTKLAINTYITTKISYANMLARLCEQLPGANVDIVTGAVGSDSRIGNKYLKGAVSYGGPCFPRDNIALTALGDQLGVDVSLPRKVDTYNRLQIFKLADLVERVTYENEFILVLGLTYKPDTDVRTEAAGSLLVRELRKRELKVLPYDAYNLDPITLRAVIALARVIVVTVPSKEFKELTIDDWTRGHMPKTFIDCWREFGQLSVVEEIEYIPLGIRQGAK